MIKLSEHFYPLIDSKVNIYKFVDGKEIINWNRLVLFTAFDIINSPFKDSMVKQAKYSLKQRELYLESLKKNANKENNENNGNDSNEKNDNNENNDKDTEIIDKDENQENNKNEGETEEIDNKNDNDNENDNEKP